MRRPCRLRWLASRLFHPGRGNIGRVPRPSHLCEGWGARAILQQLAGALFPYPPPAKSEHRQAANRGNRRQRVVCHQARRAGAQFQHQQRQNQPAHHPSGKDGEQKWRHPHLKDARGEHADFPRRGRGQHRRDHDGQEFLPFKPVAHLFEMLAIDLLEQE